MCACDFDPPEFYDSNFVKGRKEYRCIECACVIPPGEMQEYVSGKWDGHFDCFRTCMRCVDLREALQMDCFAHGHLVDDISNADELTAAMEQFMQERQNAIDRLRAEREAAKVGANS